MKRFIGSFFSLLLLMLPLYGQQVIKHDLAYAPAPIDNPLKGLVPYVHSGDAHFPHSMEFSYLFLSDLVTGPDSIDFSPLDKLLDDVASRGHQTVFRVCLEYPGKENLLPEFLLKDGLKVTRWKRPDDPNQTIDTPDYTDQALRRTLNNLIAKLGQRYDNDARIAYITAGLLGIWGEWHTYPRTELFPGKEIQQEILTAYAQAFKKTPILLRYPAGPDHPTYTDTSSRPFGYHDDSFAWTTRHTGKSDEAWFFESELIRAGLRDAWQRYPIGGEIRPEVWGCCFDPTPCTPRGQSFDACRKAIHVSWLLDSGMFREKPSPERYERAQQSVRKMGYEFHIEKASLTGETVHIDIRNTGNAPLYHWDWQPEWAALDAQGKPLKTWRGSFSLRGLLPNESATTFRDELQGWAALQPNVTLAVKIPNRLDKGKPLRFANKGQTVKNTFWLPLISFRK